MSEKSRTHHAATAPVGAADTLFGKSAVTKGLIAADTASLTKALDGLRAAGTDSDGDGAKDLDELSWGGDPNQADVPESGNSDPVTYGCSSGRQPIEGGGAGILFGMIAVVAARRGRRVLKSWQPAPSPFYVVYPPNRNLSM